MVRLFGEKPSNPRLFSKRRIGVREFLL